MSETTALSKNEIFQLATHEATIKSGLKSFIDVGRALAIIKDNKLYRNTHKTFNDYCSDRWKITPSTAYRNIKAANIADTLPVDAPKPTSERQIRAMAGLPENQRSKIWVEANTRAAGRQVTSSDIDNAVKDYEDVVLSEDEDGIIVLDRAGHVVPEHLCELFCSDNTAVLLVSIQALRREIAEFVNDNKGGEAFYINLQEVDKHMRDVRDMLKAAQPYSICQSCNALDSDCDVCNGKGWVTEDGHKKKRKIVNKVDLRPDDFNTFWSEYPLKKSRDKQLEHGKS